tara:strand:+ start:551 stop:2275 length:1725 start_codon:yes stop_codon:yes gene_type:complete
MFDHLFENRNTTVTHLIKLADCLGRSLRENLEIFSIDSEKKEVAFLTEQGKVVTGSYTLDEDITLTNIRVQDSSIFTDNTIFDTYVNEKVSGFVGKLNSNQYGEADGNFTDILSLWENRLKFENVKKRVDEKQNLFSEDQNIINTPQFQHFLEMMPQITSFLEEERDTISKVEEIENAIKLSNSVSKAFNFPRVSYEELSESEAYTIAKGLNKSIYELICKQELVKKELLESKKNFEDVWATNPKIRQLASLIFEDSSETVLESLVDAVVEVPYLALTTKKQLFESMNNAFSLSDDAAISSKDLKEYVAVLFEMKKPLKQVILTLLNEKYGINVQNLKETATFEGLANTQVVIFEALSRLAPKGSVVKETLSELSKMLKSKNGVEVIDINELIQTSFEECGYDSFCVDYTLAEEISFDAILTQEVNITDLLEKAKEKLLFDKKKRQGDEDGLDAEGLAAKKSAEADEASPDNEAGEEDDSITTAEKRSKSKKKKKTEVKEENEGGEEDSEPEAPPTEGEEAAPEEAEEEAPEPLSKEEFLSALDDVGDLLKGMSDNDDDDEDEDEDSEVEQEEE